MILLFRLLGRRAGGYQHFTADFMQACGKDTLVCTAVGLAMGVAFLVLSVLPDADPPITLLGIGLFSLAFGSLVRISTAPERS